MHASAEVSSAGTCEPAAQSDARFQSSPDFFQHSTAAAISGLLSFITQLEMVDDMEAREPGWFAHSISFLACGGNEAMDTQIAFALLSWPAFNMQLICTL